MKRFIHTALGVLVAISHGCNPRSGVPEPAFYYWKTRLSVSEEQRDYLSGLGARKIYVKFFDVDWDGGPVPLAEVEIDTARLGGLDIVPCVFITNRCVAQLPESGTAQLAARILQKTEELAAQYPGIRIREVQADCDWTASTRERYFNLLRRLRANLNAKGIILSATVRLHQYRRPEQTGVPPADRGMLMCYNTGDLEKWEEENSILRAEDVRQYTAGAGTYPLPLDVALPVFRWGVLFRDGRMIRLLHGLAPEHLGDSTRFRRTSVHRFEVIKSTFWDGYYLYEGDCLRLEAPEWEDLAESARLLQKVWRRSGRGTTAAFYHLDSTAVQHYPPKALSSLFRE